MQLSVREVDEKVFREFKAEAVREGLNVGEAISIAMELWLESRDRKPGKSLLKMRPVSWGKGTGRASGEVDEAAYGSA